MKTNDLHIDLPASKSLSNRWLVLNHIMGSPFMLKHLSEADDTQLMSALLNQLRHRSSTLFYCHNAGSVARFMLALLAVTPGQWRLTGDDRLKQRPMLPLIQCLRSMGSTIVCSEEEGFLPLDITGFIPQHRMAEIDPNESSQYVSAMLLIGCMLPNGLTLTLTDRAASRPYIEMTCALLTQAGIKNSVSPNRRVYRVEPLQPDTRHKKQVVNIESDWSSASYIYAAACLVPGLRIRMKGLSYSHSTQGDRVVKELFAQLGVETQELRSPYRTNTRSIAIIGTGRHPDTFEYNFIDCPDLLPAVLVSCAALGMKARLRGIKNLRIKESDRINALKQELEKMGASITQTPTEVRLAPAHPASPLERGAASAEGYVTKPSPIDYSPLTPCPSIRTHSDHRIAMAFGVLTLLFPDMVIEEPEQVSKSFPDFWHQLDLIKKAAEGKTES
jgi:3-phosphoshikimate 1-carboxyvinyltransferase